ncbi:PQQ-dependent sugar dehydrogenase [Sulfurivermis fontis]|uniref:PQQ-dependent sugar dehydrogenase n=1 Tax=Sulfurivermis fontis TaxID=1972068 RepID=UPI000FD8F45B|nr:PQQ-dependent sugar dehydrogenase [Sulfurivermis fontis]
MRTLILSLLLWLVLPAQAQPVFESAQQRFRVETVVDGLEHPWSLAFLPDGTLLVSERPGRLRVVRDGRLLPQAVSGLPQIAARGQGGLLDVVPHPQFASNDLIYFSYAAAGEGGYTTRVARGRFDGGRLALADVQVLFEALPRSRRTHHFGSRLVFDRAGFLYITVGDRGDMDRAQQLDDHAGSVLRLHDDGRIPADNPFLGRKDVRPEIYSYGHRNPQGMTLHPDTGAVWLHEHGARGGDEINIVHPGLNYGWPVITHGVDYTYLPIGIGTHKEGMEQPLYHWTPSIAPSGMAFYSGDAFPRWRGNLFVGALAGEHLARLTLDGEKVVAEERLLTTLGRRIRDVRQGPDGRLWLLTDHDSGQLLRLEPVK